MRGPRASERFENGGDDRAREVGGQAIDGDALLLEEGSSVAAEAGAAGELILVGEAQRRVLPQRLLLLHIVELDADGDGEAVAARQLPIVETNRGEPQTDRRCRPARSRRRQARPAGPNSVRDSGIRRGPFR